MRGDVPGSSNVPFQWETVVITTMKIITTVVKKISFHCLENSFMWNNSFFEQAGEMRHDSIIIFFPLKCFKLSPRRCSGGFQLC